MKAIVFDFDGVFIDTEILKTKSYFNCITDPEGAYKVSVPGGWDEYVNKHSIGLGRQTVCELIINMFNLKEVAETRATEIKNRYNFGEYGVGSIERKIFEENLNEYPPKGHLIAWKSIAFDRGVLYETIKDDAPLIEPAKEFLQEVKKTHLKLGLVTHTKREVTLKHLKRISIPPELFDTVVCESDLQTEKRTKTDLYITACSKLGVSPASAVAIEDTAKGVLGAKNAMMGFVIAVPTFLTRTQDFISAGADLITSKLTMFTNTRLKEFIAGLKS